MPIGRNFEDLEKNGLLLFFERVVGAYNNVVHGLLKYSSNNC